MVFCDGAHQGLKNCDTKTHQIFKTVVSKRKILLTGTPSPNDLMDYYNLIYRVNPNVLGTPAQFEEEYKNPIKRGSHKRATAHDTEYMERCCEELKEKVKDVVDFQSQEYVKKDFVLGVALTKPQLIMYEDYLNRENPDTGNKAKRYCLADFHVFNHLITHPWLLIRDHERIGDVKGNFEIQNIC
uniref:SNF2 N-terminal domain-containing protein n=1 Tax=Panagrolaimus davidi TaxID=227884 RepID=A0A914QCU1_9BILA